MGSILTAHSITEARVMCKEIAFKEISLPVNDYSIKYNQSIPDTIHTGAAL
jgi:hypothetical protein